MKQALALYKMEKSKPVGEKSASLRKVCQIISDDYYFKTRKRINLDPNTLARWEKGETSLTDYNVTKSQLTHDEQQVIVEYVLEMALRGFLLIPKQLWEHAEKNTVGRTWGYLSRRWAGKELGNTVHHQTPWKDWNV